MSVSSIGGYASSYAMNRVNASARSGSANASSASFGSPESGSIPPIPDSLKQKISSILEGGGSIQDIQQQMKAGIAEFKNSDEYKSLSSEQKSQFDKMAENGPPMPSGFGGDPFAQLKELGQSRLVSQSSASSTSADSQQNLMDLLAKLSDSTAA